MQPDLFAPPLPVPRCGNCVNRNALEHEDLGCCPYVGQRHKGDPACVNWFGLDELRKPLYGRNVSRQ